MLDPGSLAIFVSKELRVAKSAIGKNDEGDYRNDFNILWFSRAAVSRFGAARRAGFVATTA
jgi:hypothetical protein